MEYFHLRDIRTCDKGKNLNFLIKKKQILSTGKCPKSLNISYNDDLKSDKES